MTVLMAASPRQYETELHGQHVQVTVLPPHEANATSVLKLKRLAKPIKHRRRAEKREFQRKRDMATVPPRISQEVS